MASSSYDINVNTSQAVRNVRELNTALAGLATAAVVKGFVDAIEVTNNLQNKFKQITQEGQTSADVFALMAKTANQLGAPLKDVGNLFFRIANTTKDLGLKQTDQLRLTQLLSKAFQSNGLSVSEASSAVTQFSQALAKGTLNGDELNSILENAPPIAQAIADKLGVTVGALRTLGSQGKLNSRLVVDAMLEAGASIDKAFANRVPSISNAWNVFGNTIDVVSDKFNKQNNVTQGVSIAIIKLATAVINISNFFTKWGGVIYNVITFLAAFLIPIRLITAGVALLGGAMSRLGTVWGSISTVVAATTGAFEKFKVIFVGVFDAIFPTLAVYINTFTKMIATTVAFVASFLGLESVFQSIKDFFKEGEKGANPYEQAINDLNKALGVDQAEALNKAKDAKQAKDEVDLKNADLIKKSVTDLTNAYADMTSQLKTDTASIGLGQEQADKLRLQTEAANKYTESVRKIHEEMGKLDQTGKTAETEAVKELTNQYKNELDVINQLYDSKVKEQRLEDLRKFTLQQQYDTQDKLKSLQDDIAKTTMTEIEKKHYDIEQAAKASAEAEIRAAAERRGISREQMPTSEVQAYYAASTNGVKDLIKATDEQYVKNREFSTGWKNAMNSYVDDATNAAKQAESIFSKTMSGMEDMIVNFAKTGKLEWKGFIASILEDLLRSQIKQQIASIFGLANGATSASGGGGGLLGMLGFANGGLIPTNGPVLVGERGPEIIAGAAGRTVIPNHELGQGTGMTNITYNINAVDAKSFKQMIAADPNFIYAVTQQGAKSMPGVR